MRSLLSSPTREQDILVRRLGFERPPETLRQIADDLGLTRERVRQIEARTLRKWIRELYLNRILEQKIKQLLIGRNSPLPITEAETADPWFEGVSSHKEFFKNLVRAMCRDSIHFIDIDDLLYFSLMDNETWNRTVSDAEKLLSSKSEQGWSEDYARSQVRSLLPDNAKEFGQALWDKLFPLCHFVTEQGNSRILIDYGRGAEKLVKVILAESDRPLHYTEIAERSKLGKKKELDPRRAQNAAANVALLLGSGTYGLARHIPFSDEQMSQIRKYAEDIVFSQTSGRQWHTSEILSEISADPDGEFEGLDKYVLDVALSESKVLKPLGRMTWVTGNDNAEDQTRIDIRRAVIAIVKEAGHPLSTDEIRERLTAVRGVSEFFQVQPFGPLVRIRRAVWGIKDRDLPLSHEEQREVIENVVRKLDTKQSGIHISELREFPPVRDCPLETLVSIVIQDKRLKVETGSYVYLTEWGESRLETMSCEISSIVEDASGPITLEEIAVLAERKVGRKINKGVIYGVLHDLEAEFDRTAKKWNLNKPVDQK